jgi:hypothetical protein
MAKTRGSSLGLAASPNERGNMRRFAGVLVVAAGVGVAIPTSASASPSAAQGCFGQFVSSYARNPGLLGVTNLGQFVSSQAQASVPFGQNGVPVYKGLACGG